MKRRDFLHSSSALLATLLATRWGRPTVAAPPLLIPRELDVPGDPKLADRALLFIPAHAAGETLPLLVLLHGLGETHSARIGVRAWSQRYGLVSAYERLCRPPVERTMPKTKYLTDEHLEQLAAELRAQAFSGMVLVCPFTPNVYRQPSTKLALDRYADWLEGDLLPAVTAAAPVRLHREFVAIDGCSLGGYMSLEVFLRKPKLFGSVGMVQGAIGTGAARTYAESLTGVAARHEGMALRLGTSSQDPYRGAHEALSQQLRRRSVAHTFELHPGPHDQPWLREVGSLAMLHWHDRQFARRR